MGSFHIRELSSTLVCDTGKARQGKLAFPMSHTCKLICVMAGKQMLLRSVLTCLNKWIKRWREQLHFGSREMGVWHIELSQHEGV